MRTDRPAGPIGASELDLGSAYHAALAALAARGRFGIRLGLGRTRALLRELGDPQLGIRGALVGGTNGKGSVLALAGSALRAAGLRAGETPKPHLVSYRERLQIAGRPVDAGTFAELVRDAIAAADRLPRRLGDPTEFELLTAVVFRWFADEGVDLALVEVGLGGRLDATNIVSPVAVAIVSIDFDHQAQLGNTLASIAAEKAGVIKPGIPVVCGPLAPEALQVIAATCAEVRTTSASSVTPWLRQLSIPLLKTAIRDESLFSDREHYTRQIVNAVAELEFYGDDASGQNAVARKIQALLQEIENADDATPELFQKVLRELNSLIRIQHKAYEENVREVVMLEQAKPAVAGTGTSQVPAEDETTAEWQKRVRRLKIGNSIMLDADTNPRRLKIAWIGKNFDRYVFVNVRGLKEQALHRDELVHRLRSGSAIVLDDGGEPLVDRAQYSMLQKMHRHLLHETTHDQLTGLINRRELERLLTEALADTRQHESHHVLCHFDLTQFNVVNNTFGYAAGDRVLLEVAELLEREIGAMGIVARIGGDEFAALFSHTTIADVLGLTARLKAAFIDYRYTIAQQSLGLSFSAGLVPLLPESASAADVLQSAETMKAAVAYLEPLMDKVDGSSTKGRIVLATVKGDVHDIGKNLVDIILTNNGYEVHNLGIKVNIADMVAKAVEVKADAIGMSGLLVKSTLIMRENLEELNARGLAEVPVLLGGAALTRTYVERDLREVYDGRLFYGKDAFEGLHVMDRIGAVKRGEQPDDPDWGTVPIDSTLELRGRFAPAGADDADAPELPERSPDVVADNPVFRPPFLGTQVVKGIPIDDIAAFINETALFRNQWQFRPEKGESDEDFKARLRPQLREELAKAKAAGLLVPQVVYGYFPANSDGDDLVIWTDESRREELARFRYPRQRKAPFHCISDFFRPIESGEPDYAAFHVVTMGLRASERERELFAADRYQEYLLLHGLSVEMAEAMAEYVHKRIRAEWGFGAEDDRDMDRMLQQGYRGGRYSFGYPACPKLEDQVPLLRLLDAERVGVSLSDEWQLHPEQSTSAIVLHHPRAKYFSV